MLSKGTIHSRKENPVNNGDNMSGTISPSASLDPNEDDVGSDLSNTSDKVDDAIEAHENSSGKEKPINQQDDKLKQDFKDIIHHEVQKKYNQFQLWTGVLFLGLAILVIYVGYTVKQEIKQLKIFDNGIAKPLESGAQYHFYEDHTQRNGFPIYFAFEGARESEVLQYLQKNLKECISDVELLELPTEIDATVSFQLQNTVTLYIFASKTEKIGGTFDEAEYNNLVQLTHGNAVFLITRQYGADSPTLPIKPNVKSGINLENSLKKKAVTIELRHVLKKYHDDFVNRKQIQLLCEVVAEKVENHA